MLGFFAGVIRFRLLILAAAAAIMTGGFVQLRQAPVDVLRSSRRRMRDSNRGIGFVGR
jgi:hypothetical protein